MPKKIPYLQPIRNREKKQPARDDSNRPSAAERGYCSRAHREWRKAVLTADAWTCRACGKLCSGDREAHADHIVPVSIDESLRYDIKNGQCLCAACHARKGRTDGSRRQRLKVEARPDWLR
jgi:5-methylcytosine-specific restriction endonuclease McrA